MKAHGLLQREGRTYGYRLTLHNVPRFDQTQYTFMVAAESDTAAIGFSGHALQDYYYLDDVNVKPIPTPEPSTFLLVLGGVTTSVRFRRSSDCIGRWWAKRRSR